MLNLVVNDDGSDAGAICVFFFKQLTKEIYERMFEGDRFRRVPKKDSDLCCYFELAGRMVTLFVLQGGQSIDYLSPAI